MEEDFKLPIPRPPSFDSLLEFLCRRLVPTGSLHVVKLALKLVLNVLLSLLGLKDAQKRYALTNQQIFAKKTQTIKSLPFNVIN